ncbi:hypothetical protein Tco_1433569, partial [Tanacetum coccineum]
HQNDDDEEMRAEGTSQNSTPSPRSYYNSLSPIKLHVFKDLASPDQTMSTLFSRQTSMLNRQETMHVEQRGSLKLIEKALKGIFRNKK